MISRRQAGFHAAVDSILPKPYVDRLAGHLHSAARLITVNQDGVQVAHEAVIRQP
jgi:RecB family endonuclease NucS